ncbi:MAG: phosphopantetheine-binding protein [Pontixanthobacter sp.]
MSGKPVAERDLARESSMAPNRETIDIRLRAILGDVLGLDPARLDALSNDTGLFGHIPELDSMAVAGLLTEMEDRLDIVIDDEDVDTEMLETYGGLLTFAEAKMIQN